MKEEFESNKNAKHKFDVLYNYWLERWFVVQTSEEEEEEIEQDIFDIRQLLGEDDQPDDAFGMLNASMKQKVVVIYGPTSSGKTALSLAIAQQLQRKYDVTTEIISADSCQVYKGMTIGTNKVSMEEQQLVAHHNIDVETPDNQYTSDRFLQTVTEIASATQKRGNIPLIVGGSMSLVSRLINDGAFDFLILIPAFDGKKLNKRIKTTVAAMFEQGLYDEVLQLTRQYRGCLQQLGKTIGYLEFLNYADKQGKDITRLNEKDLATIKTQIIEAHKAYATRQIALLEKMQVCYVRDQDEGVALVVKHYGIVRG